MENEGLSPAELKAERDARKVKYHATSVYKRLCALNDAVWEATSHGVTAEELGLPKMFELKSAIEKTKSLAKIDWTLEKTNQKDRDYFASVV